MHNLLAAIGPTAHARQPKWGISAEVQAVVRNEVRVERCSPRGQPLPDWHSTSHSGGVQVFLDGELIVNDLLSECRLGAHLTAFAQLIETRGIDYALQRLIGGSFVAVVLDRTGRAVLLRDPLGSIPVYEAHAGADWLISTNPLVLARESDVDNTPDRIGLASWALVGYTIGTRHLVRGVRSVDLGVQRVREPDGTVRSGPLPFDPFAQMPLSDGGPSVTEITEAFARGCERMAATQVPTAHMQSGGMDSRLILAAWPQTQDIACYGYGDPDSGEVDIARQVAQLRSAAYHHAQPSGDQVAQMLPDVYEAAGLMVFPERWHLADRIAADGHHRVLDGFAGGPVLGGLFSTTRQSWRSHMDKLRARHRDEIIDTPDMESIARDIYSMICELPDPARMAGYLAPDFIADLQLARDDVINDIRDELERLRPADNSVALLVRNFTIANRTAHSIALQGVLSRRTLAVAFPFAADYGFLKLALSVPLSRAAYRRLHMQVFCAHFPRYAEIPYGGGSMLPLHRSAAAHQISKTLLGRGIRVGGLTGPLTRSPNNWATWLRESEALRELTGDALRAGGIAASGLQGNLRRLADGVATASGKLLHMASIGRWLAGTAPRR